MADNGIPLTSAIRMATEMPARRLGIADTVGSLAVGRRADFAVLNPDRTVARTVVCGQTVYSV